MICFLFCASLCLCAKPAEEKKAGETVNLAVMQGPSGFSSVMLDPFVNVSVFPSPNEAFAELVNGDADMAVLPADVVFSLTGRGFDVRCVAVVGEGMLSLIGSDITSEDISVPGSGGTPAVMAELLYGEYGMSVPVSSPAQLAQLVIAGRIKLAILPEPFVTMILDSNPQIRVFEDVNERWEQLTGYESFPMSLLVVSGRFADSNPLLVEKAARSYCQSVEKVLSDPESAAKLIEEKGIMSADIAAGAVPKCRLVWIDGEAARQICSSYCLVISGSRADESVPVFLPALSGRNL